MLERTFQAKVTKALKTLMNTYFIKIADRAKSGIPDFLCCIDGNFVALELKRSNVHKATPLQLHTLMLIRDAQGMAIVANPENWNDVFEGLVVMAGGVKKCLKS